MSSETMVLVPLAFVQQFNTMAHNYSLGVIPPDYYFGTERDAFVSAYARCSKALLELRDLLPANPQKMKVDNV